MITITIETDNAAFDDGNRGAEVARILTALAREFARMDGRSIDNGHKLHDVNGNTVGAVKLTGKDRTGA